MITDYLIVFSWGLAVLAAFVGWGSLLTTTVFPAARQDWGLRAGIGMAATLAIGGIASLTGVVSASLLIGFVLIGAAMFLIDAVRAGIDLAPPSRLQFLLIVLVVSPVLLRYASVVHYQAFSCGDDDIAYFPLIRRLLDTGTLIEPFSLRRLAGYGGQTFLQALVGAIGTEENAFLVDRGIAVIISFGLIAGFFRNTRIAGTLPYAIALLLVIVLPFPMLNSASHITGLTMFLVLFRVLDMQTVRDNTSVRSICLVAMVVSAAASLRAHFLAAAAITVVLYWLQAASTRQVNWHIAVASLFRSGGMALLYLAPWMILLQISSNSFLYPLIRGNHQRSFENYSASLDLWGHVRFLADTLSDPKFLLFVVPTGILLFVRRTYPAALSLYGGALLTSVAMAWVFTQSDTDNIYRYVAPFLNAAFMAAIVSITRDARASSAPENRPTQALGDKVIVGVLIVLLPLMMNKDIERLTDRWAKVGLTAAERSLYADVLDAVPPGQKVMAIVNHPYAFDYARNDIAAIDVPGAASPAPGVPYFKGAMAFKSYFLNRGIRYLIVDDFERPGACLYNRQLWQFHLSGNVPVWKMGARYYLDLMDMLSKLMQSEQVIYQKGGFAVIKLKPV